MLHRIVDAGQNLLDRNLRGTASLIYDLCNLLVLIVKDSVASGLW